MRTEVITDPQYATDSIMIYKQADRLYGDLSTKSGMHISLFAQAYTLFYLAIIKRIPTTI
jgi:hypothetical protein